MDQKSTPDTTEVPSVETILEGFENQIKYCARNMRGRYCITDSDIPDIEQELRLAIFKAYPAFSLKKCAAGPYFQVVIDNARKKIIRKRKQLRIEKRLPQVISAAEVEEGERVNGILLETIPAPDGPEVIYKDILDIADELSGDVKEAFLLLAFGEEKTVKAVAERLGIPRTTFRRKFVPTLQSVLLSHGIGGH